MNSAPNLICHQFTLGLGETLLFLKNSYRSHFRIQTTSDTVYMWYGSTPPAQTEEWLQVDHEFTFERGIQGPVYISHTEADTVVLVVSYS